MKYRENVSKRNSGQNDSMVSKLLGNKVSLWWGAILIVFIFRVHM